MVLVGVGCCVVFSSLGKTVKITLYDGSVSNPITSTQVKLTPDGSSVGRHEYTSSSGVATFEDMTVGTWNGYVTDYDYTFSIVVTESPSLQGKVCILTPPEPDPINV